MLTTENVKQLVRGFLHEACGYLGIDDSLIGICLCANASSDDDGDAT